MSILNKISWIDSEKLVGFIISAQDPETGGIADRAGDMVDVFHTHFGVAGTSKRTRPVRMSALLKRIHHRSVAARISWFGRFRSGVLHACKHHRSKGTQERMEGTAAKVSLTACIIFVVLASYRIERFIPESLMVRSVPVFPGEMGCCHACSGVRLAIEYDGNAVRSGSREWKLSKSPHRATGPRPCSSFPTNMIRCP